MKLDHIVHLKQILLFNNLSKLIQNGLVTNLESLNGLNSIYWWLSLWAAFQSEWTRVTFKSFEFSNYSSVKGLKQMRLLTLWTKALNLLTTTLTINAWFFLNWTS